jgi:hypothetical protein
MQQFPDSMQLAQQQLMLQAQAQALRQFQQFPSWMQFQQFPFFMNSGAHNTAPFATTIDNKTKTSTTTQKMVSSTNTVTSTSTGKSSSHTMSSKFAATPKRQITHTKTNYTPPKKAPNINAGKAAGGKLAGASNVGASPDSAAAEAVAKFLSMSVPEVKAFMDAEEIARNFKQLQEDVGGKGKPKGDYGRRKAVDAMSAADDARVLQGGSIHGRVLSRFYLNMNEQAIYAALKLVAEYASTSPPTISDPAGILISGMEIVVGEEQKPRTLQMLRGYMTTLFEHFQTEGKWSHVTKDSVLGLWEEVRTVALHRGYTEDGEAEESYHALHQKMFEEVQGTPTPRMPHAHLSCSYVWIFVRVFLCMQCYSNGYVFSCVCPT